MKPRRLQNGNLLIPVRVEAVQGQQYGDAMQEVAPGSVAYETWLPYVLRQERIDD